MLALSFTQLIASHAFEIPLPKKADTWCRECAGPIEQEQAIRKKYGPTWVDEGVIPYTGSHDVCPACIKLAKGSTSRSTTIPVQGAVMIASPSYIHPKKPSWDTAYIEDGKEAKKVKKTEVYTESIDLIDFLENIFPELELPFGAVYSERGSKNQKHYLRYVPLNYNKHNITLYVMPTFGFAEIQPQRFLTAYYDSLELIELAPAKLREQFIIKAKEHNLGNTEARMLYRHLYSVKFKEADNIDQE